MLAITPALVLPKWQPTSGPPAGLVLCDLNLRDKVWGYLVWDGGQCTAVSPPLLPWPHILPSGRLDVMSDYSDMVSLPELHV